MIDLVDVVHFLNEVLIGFIEPFKVTALNVEGELLVLMDRSMTYFVHLVELAFENDEITTFLGLSVNHTCFELLEGVDNFEEVSVIEEKAKVF